MLFVSFCVSSFGYGLAVSSFFSVPKKTYLLIASGASILSLLAFSIGQFFFQPLLFYVLLATGVVISVACALSKRRRWRFHFPFGNFYGGTCRGACFLVIGLGLFLGLGFLASLAPSLYWDELHYHLTVPKFYLHRGFIAPPAHMLYGFFPQGMEMLFAFFLVFFPSGAGSASIHFLFLLLLLFLLTDLLSELAKTWRLFAAFCLVTTPVLLIYSTFSYVDVAFAFYLCAAFFLAKEGRMLPAAFFLGSACAVKYTGLIFFFLFCFFQLLSREPTKRKALTLIVSLLPFFPYLLRNMLDMGNPIYPFFSSLFGGRGLLPSKSEEIRQSIVGFGGSAKTVANLLLAPFFLTFQGERFAGFIGCFYLMGLPLLLKQLSRSYGAKLAVLYFLFWFLTSQQARFLIPSLFFFLASVIPVLTHLPRLARLIFFSFIGSQAALFLLWFAVLIAPRLSVALGLLPETKYLQTLETYQSIQWLNQKSSVKKVWMANDNRVFFLNKPFEVTSDFIRFDPTMPAEQRLRELQDKGISHIFLTLSLCRLTRKLCKTLAKDSQRGYLKVERFDAYTVIWRVIGGSNE